MTDSANLEDARPLAGSHRGELVQELIGLVQFCATTAEVADLLTVASNVAWMEHEYADATDYWRAQLAQRTEKQVKSLRRRRAAIWARKEGSNA